MELSAKIRWSLVMRNLRLSEMILQQKQKAEAAQLSKVSLAINLQVSEKMQRGSMYPLKLNLRSLKTE